MDYRREADRWQTTANDYFFKSSVERYDGDVQRLYGMGMAFQLVAKHYRQLAENQDHD